LPRKTIDADGSTLFTKGPTMNANLPRRVMLRATGSLAAANMLPAWATADDSAEKDDGSF
jgi:hypothetical protein